jgi:hypothetical protein
VLRLQAGEFFQQLKQQEVNWLCLLSVAINHLTGLNSFSQFSNLFIISKLAEGFKMADLVAIDRSSTWLFPILTDKKTGAALAALLNLI